MDGWDQPSSAGSGYGQQYQQSYNNGNGNGAYGSGGGAGGGYGARDQGWAPRRGGRGGRQSGGGGGGGGYYQGARGGGGGGGYQQQQPSVEQREENRIRYIRSQLFKLGEEKDFHPPSDLLKMARWIEDKATDGIEPITGAFRVMVTEQPHKTPLIAALIGFLCLSQQSKPAAPPPRNPDDADLDADQDQEMAAAPSSDPDSLGITIVKDLVKAFRSYLDARLWRNTRLSLHLFAALVPLHIIPAHSLRTLLASFAAVLEEPAVAAARADRAAMCIIETLCRAGQDLLSDSEGARAELDDLIQKVVTYDAARKVEVELTEPVHDLEAIWLEGFSDAVKALEELRARDYRRPIFLPVPSDLLPAAISPAATQVPEGKRIVSLPDVLVPPEEDAEDQGLDVAYAQLGEHQVKRRKIDTGKGELEEKKAAVGPERVSLQPRWFSNTLPKVASPASVVLRAVLADMIDLYEVNRKEAAKLILDLPNWVRRGTFSSKNSPEAGLFGEMDDPQHPDESGYSLDDLLVETILSTAFVLPAPPRNPLYYTGLLREIVTLTPGTVAPSLGRTIRTFYNALSSPTNIDVETVHRFADWFAIHLSNFNFGWAWKEWIPDTSLPATHPKVVFMRRIVELEIRLAYFERVQQTLPAEIQALALPKQEPGATFTYADEAHPYAAQAGRLINSIKAKASAEVILADFETFKSSIIETTTSLPTETSAGMVPNATQADVVVRDLTIQCILSVGSRSFSHFLNIVERYHALLRQLSRSGRMRAAILAGAVRFWNASQQWVHIVVDKLLQYRIVEPADVVEFIFSPPVDEPGAIRTGGEREGWAGFNTWTLLRLTLEKVNGRVDQLQKRLEEIQRKEGEEAERKEAAAAAGLPFSDEPEAAPEKAEPLFPTSATLPIRPEEKSAEPSSTEALANLDAIKSEQRKVLILSVTGFKNLLLSADGSQDEWTQWWISSWYKQFVRCFNRQLLQNRQTLLTNCFGETDGETGERTREWLERAIDVLSE
ncbi:MIF4G-like, type 2 [Kalmanozyma brasiliensis GHG001]|uniref:80 kDa nuclear cap binding protein n=1 Tax=Kalmanozyma brasiliensis (strain GHG001) TaxID=1365824 RepID=V5ENX7_KALBG|nr:MIF4G-like, type 2 [Kalmanozyma brasiliensis GHG001]EST06805.1 MIF4G-like, type 2 [Kalmanozyma brasiliensis GHG001]